VVTSAEAVYAVNALTWWVVYSIWLSAVVVILVTQWRRIF
jgi:hypothetical protein